MSNIKYSLEESGHKWLKDEDGEVNMWVLDMDYHNGPYCEACEQSFCEHCEDNMYPKCEGVTFWDDLCKS
jgi:DNA primase catalytic subunit